MDTVSEPTQSTTDLLPAPTATLAPPPAPARAAVPAPRPARRERRQLALGRFGLPVTVYLGTRLALLALAFIETAVRHRSVWEELANWDGRWYRALALGGYPTHVAHAQTTLGFLPVYALSMRGLAYLFGSVTPTSVTVAGLIVSGIGGLLATLLVQELASGWWGPSTGRRAALLFCLFPGSVVFSMVYSEGLLLPLAAGCLLALQRRRWLLAGVLAGVATAVEPDALPLVLACAVSAGLELRRTRGGSRRSLLAPVISLSGVVACGAFLWAWAGTPLANYQAQRYGWGEKTDPFALVHQASSLLREISFAHFDHPTINLNLVAGLAGAVFLVGGIVLLLRRPRAVSIEALIWTAGVAFLALTSEFVPPNPRLLITAFPVVIVFARYVRGRWLLVLNGALLIGMSYLTFYGHTLRP